MQFEIFDTRGRYIRSRYNGNFLIMVKVNAVRFSGMEPGDSESTIKYILKFYGLIIIGQLGEDYIGHYR